jgi:hypothetical protein
MDTVQIIQSQYLAALAMLEQAVEKCPGNLWNVPENRNKFWHVAYHALFYTHLYLQPTGAEFHQWERHRQDYEFLGPKPWPPHDMPVIGDPYTPGDMLDYLAFVRRQVRQCLPSLDLEGASGFEWLPFGKLELQIYNIRHLQHHTAELYERLGAGAGMDMDWIGTAS